MQQGWILYVQNSGHVHFSFSTPYYFVTPSKILDQTVARGQKKEESGPKKRGHPHDKNEYIYIWHTRSTQVTNGHFEKKKDGRTRDSIIFQTCARAIRYIMEKFHKIEYFALFLVRGGGESGS